MEDVSLGGLFVNTSDPLPTGTDLALELVRPDGAPILVSARVASVVPGKGMGLEFHPLAESQRRALARLMASMGFALQGTQADEARLRVQIRGLTSEVDAVGLELNRTAEEIDTLEREVAGLRATLTGIDAALELAAEGSKS